MSAPSALADALVLALGAALEGPKLLLSTSGKSAVSGLFPSGVKGKALADTAVREGYLERREEVVKAGKKTSKVIFGIITEKGIRAFVEHNSPKDALNALVPAVQQLSASAPAPDTTAVVTAIENAAAGCAQAVRNAFAAFRTEVLEALPKPAPAVDPTPILAALQAALGKVEPVRLNLPDSRPSDPEPSTRPDPAGSLSDEVIAFVTDWAREKTVGPPFDEIARHLRVRHPRLTVGEFHDALRTLSSGPAPRLRLSGWSKTIHELPEPELALFVKHTVSYYAHPAH